MQVCRRCQAEFSDEEKYCPECGSPIFKDTGLSLKSPGSDSKKKTNPMGTSISTGSGLTDILKIDDAGETEDGFYGTAARNLNGLNYADDAPKKRKKRIPAGIKSLILLAIIVAVGYFVYNSVFKLDSNTAKSGEGVAKCLETALKDRSSSEMKDIIAPYVDRRSDVANDMAEYSPDITIDSVSMSVQKNDKYSSMEAVSKYSTALVEERGVTAKSYADIKEYWNVQFTINGFDNKTKKAIGTKLDATIVLVENKWYIDTTSFSEFNLK